MKACPWILKIAKTVHDTGCVYIYNSLHKTVYYYKVSLAHFCQCFINIHIMDIYFYLFSLLDDSIRLILFYLIILFCLSYATNILFTFLYVFVEQLFLCVNILVQF